MSRGPPLQPQLSKLAESSIPAEEEIANGGGQVDDAMEEDVEQEGYGQSAARVSTASQRLSHSMLTRFAPICMLSFVYSNFFIDMDKLVLCTAWSRVLLRS